MLQGAYSKTIHTWCPMRLIGMDTELGLPGVHVIPVFSLRCDPQRCRVVVVDIIHLPHHMLQAGIKVFRVISLRHPPFDVASLDR